LRFIWGQKIIFTAPENKSVIVIALHVLCWGVAMMKYAAVFTLISLALTCPVVAKPHHADHDAAGKSHPGHHYAARKSHHDHHDVARKSRHADHYAARKSHDEHQYAAHASHSGITCEMVRAYVAKMGMGQAIAMAKSAGMSAADEERARHCLANKI
jgi:hypothetical protein